VLVGEVFPTGLLCCNGALDRSLAEGDQILWTCLVEIDVLHGEIHENIERVCKELAQARRMHHRVLHCGRGYGILFRVLGQCPNNWGSKGD